MPRGRPAPEREGLRYPLFRTNDRPLPADYSGPLYVWDIDNTYLITNLKPASALAVSENARTQHRSSGSRFQRSHIAPIL